MNILKRFIAWLKREKTVFTYTFETEDYRKSLHESLRKHLEKEEDYVSDRDEGIASDDSSVSDLDDEEEE